MPSQDIVLQGAGERWRLLRGIKILSIQYIQLIIIINEILKTFFIITREAKDDNLEQEISLADRRNKREIRLLEGEIPLWQVIVEKLNAASKIFVSFR